jgi:hypothetical protein
MISKFGDLDDVDALFFDFRDNFLIGGACMRE